MFKKWAFLFYLFFAAVYSLNAGQFTYPWNFYDSTGGIQDMHFMPGTNESQFLCLTEGNFAEIRNTLTGALIKQIPGVQGIFGFTADSQKIVTITISPKIELHNLADMNLLAYDSLTVRTDSIDSHGNNLSKIFLGLVVDPIRPYAYAIVRKSNFLSNPYPIDTITIVVYDCNTMKQIKVLNPEGFKTYGGAAKIAVSNDGKYLAAFTGGQTDLKIWSLDSMKLVRDVQLYNPNSNNSCIPSDLKFSELNSDFIYFTGSYPNTNYEGITKYSIQSNKVIDSSFSHYGSTAGYFFLFDNEERALCLAYYNEVINFKFNSIEFKTEITWPNPGTWGKVIYSKNNDLFIGTGGAYCSSGKYDRAVSVIENPTQSSLLYPNPTNNFVTVKNNCNSPLINYQITNLKSEMLLNSSAPNKNYLVLIDFSHFVSGIYFLNLNCENNILTYKVIKEN